MMRYFLNRSPPPALQVLLDSGAVLMETLLGDVLIGECVTMEPGSETYHDTLTYLLCWRLYLAIFKAASPEVTHSGRITEFIKGKM